MKLRINLTADVEIEDAKAFERYRSVDPHSVARSVQAAYQAEFEDDAPESITNVALVVTPLYG